MNTQTITIVCFLLLLTNPLYATQISDDHKRDSLSLSISKSTTDEIPQPLNPSDILQPKYNKLAKEVTQWVELITVEGIKEEGKGIPNCENIKNGIKGLERMRIIDVKKIPQPDVILHQLLAVLSNKNATTLDVKYKYNIARQAHRFAQVLFLANYKESENKNLLKTNKKDLEEKIKMAIGTIDEVTQPYAAGLRYELTCIQAIINGLKNGKTVAKKVKSEAKHLLLFLESIIKEKTVTDALGSLKNLSIKTAIATYRYAVKTFRIAWYAEIIYINSLLSCMHDKEKYHQVLLDLVKANPKKSPFRPYNTWKPWKNQWQILYTSLEALTAAICADNVVKPKDTTQLLFEALKNYAIFKKFLFSNNWRIQEKVGQSMVLLTHHRSPYIREASRQVIADFYTREQQTDARVLVVLKESYEIIEQKKSFQKKLYAACTQGNREEVKELLNDNLFKKNAWLLNQADKNGDTFFDRAIQQKQYKIAQILLCQPHIKIKLEKTRRNNIFLCAASHGEIAMLDHLIKTYECSLDAKDKHGRNVLLCAAWNGKIAMVNHLIKRYQCSLDETDNGGRNVLLCAAWAGNIAMVNHLITHHRCSLNAKGDDGYTLLDRVYDKMKGATSLSAWNKWDKCWDLAIKRGGKFFQHTVVKRNNALGHGLSLGLLVNTMSTKSPCWIGYGVCYVRNPDKPKAPQR